MIQVGDYVVRVSYNRDIMFKVIEILPNGEFRLKGISFRIVADAPIKDLELVGGMRFTSKESRLMEKIQQSISKLQEEQENKKVNGQPVLEKTGKVLHLDGDAFYLELCMKYYELLGIRAVGESVLEPQQPRHVAELVLKHNPDILVLTGHDALNKNVKNISDIKQYKNSRYFVEAIKEARRVSNNLVIFAGACQSNFEALLDAGADYAASPGRVLIHALDPVFLVERIAHCPFNEVLSIEQAIEYTITQFDGVGGFEILGTARKGGPVAKKHKEGRYQKVIQDDMEGLDREALKRTFSNKSVNNVQEGDTPYSIDEEEVIAEYVGNSMPRNHMKKNPRNNKRNRG